MFRQSLTHVTRANFSVEIMVSFFVWTCYWDSSRVCGSCEEQSFLHRAEVSNDRSECKHDIFLNESQRNWWNTNITHHCYLSQQFPAPSAVHLSVRICKESWNCNPDSNCSSNKWNEGRYWARSFKTLRLQGKGQDEKENGVTLEGHSKQFLCKLYHGRSQQLVPHQEFSGCMTRSSSQSWHRKWTKYAWISCWNETESSFETRIHGKDCVCGWRAVVALHLVLNFALSLCGIERIVGHTCSLTEKQGLHLTVPKDAQSFVVAVWTRRACAFSEGPPIVPKKPTLYVHDTNFEKPVR